MKIYIGADHGGYGLKKSIEEHLIHVDYEVEDDGDKKLDPSDDFPVFAGQVVHKMLASEDGDPRGILICRSGQGMCMAANRYNGIRACLGWNREAVRSSRNDDNANVLCISGDEMTEKEVMSLVDCFLKTDFSRAPRFVRRLNEIDNMA